MPERHRVFLCPCHSLASSLVSSRRSHARIIVHSASTVRLETPSTSATSATVKPPKKRSSTNLAFRGSRAASFSIASSTAGNSSSWRELQVVVRSDSVAATTPLLSVSTACVIDEDTPHDLSTDGEEVRLASPIDSRLIDQLQKRGPLAATYDRALRDAGDSQPKHEGRRRPGASDVPRPVDSLVDLQPVPR